MAGVSAPSGGSGTSPAVTVQDLSNGVAPTPKVGIHIYRCTATMTVPIPAISTWDGWVPIIVIDAAATLTLNFDSGDTVNGDGSNLVIDARYAHVMLAELTDTTAVALADPFSP